MKALRYIGLLCCAALPGGCTRTADATPAREGVTVVFRADAGRTSRTELTGSAPLQHVASAYLYIFRGTGETAPCIACEDAGWTHQDEHTTVSQRYTVRQSLTTGQYTLLAVGLDDRAGATYGLPAALAPGATLAEARAALATGKTRQDVAVSELFAGTGIASVASGQHAEVPITMSRRVAGVMGYFKNIPAEIDGNKPRTLRVVLYREQYADIPLIAAAAEADHGTTTLAGSQTLMEFDLTPYTQAAGQSYLAIPARTGAVATVENSLFGGVFLLPVEAPASLNRATLGIQLWGPEVIQDQGPSLMRTYTVKLTSGEISFPLQADHLYCMGEKPDAGTTTGDNPLDLNTEDAVIVVHPEWSGVIDLPFD